jgi:multidrug efflux system outer membrane protein
MVHTADPARQPLVFAWIAALLMLGVAHSPTAYAQAPGVGDAPAAASSSADAMLLPPPPAPRKIASWDEALTLIRSRSPDYITSYESVVRAEAQTRIALAAVLPTLDAQGAYTHQLLSPARITIGGATLVTPPADVWTAGGKLSWAIVNPRAIYGLGTADKNVELVKLTFEDRRRVIALALVNAMITTLATARVAELNRTGLRAALDRLALTQARLQFGQGTQLDVDRAQQDVAAARATLITGDESLRQAREALGVALGSPVPIAPPGDLDLDQFESGIARACRLNDDIERRPDVAAARSRVELARRAIRDAELQLAPTLNLSSQLNYSNQPVLAPNTTWSLGAVLDLPLYDGGARYGALRDSRAAFEQARQALVLARLEALVGSAQARRGVGVAEQSRDVARAQRDLAARIDWRTRDGYAHGLGTSLDLVISAQALRQADINLALLDFQVGEARANAILTNAECAY